MAGGFVMNKYSALLHLHRKTVEAHIDEGPAHVRSCWNVVEPLMEQWFTTYKKWEASDTFTEAYYDQRMTVRTFPGPPEEKKDSFSDQVDKHFPQRSISLKSKQGVRVFADSTYTAIADQQALARHDRTFHLSDEGDKYWARRGVDSSHFANPNHFATRSLKYANGLHDLSASLVNPKLSIFDQIHNNDIGAHFSFLPLSKEEDQFLLFKIIQCAKPLKGSFTPFYNKVRTYRGSMTRVKLANEFDMAVGYSAVPVANPGQGNPAYKLRYGLTSTTTILGPNGQQTVAVTPQILQERRIAAVRFKSILGIRDAKNEIVVAIRHHAGPFPVYAIRTANNELQCYSIGEEQIEAVDEDQNKYTYAEKKMTKIGRKISSMGWMS
jgi:hypothetical protein